MNEKQIMRSQLIQKRKEMSMDDVYHKSAIIQKKLEKDPVFQNSSDILFYVSYGHEVFTHDIIKKYLRRRIHVIVPRSNTQTLTIDPIIIKNWNELVKGAYGLLEPLPQNMHIAKKIDLIILPGVGFDIHRNRLGHGKGYYDRFIGAYAQAALIGLAYDFQIVQTIPTQPQDKPVDTILTEKQIIRCK